MHKPRLLHFVNTAVAAVALVAAIRLRFNPASRVR